MIKPHLWLQIEFFSGGQESWSLLYFSNNLSIEQTWRLCIGFDHVENTSLPILSETLDKTPHPIMEVLSVPGFHDIITLLISLLSFWLLQLSLTSSLLSCLILFLILHCLFKGPPWSPWIKIPSLCSKRTHTQEVPYVQTFTLWTFKEANVFSHVQSCKLAHMSSVHHHVHASSTIGCAFGNLHYSTV